MGHCRWTESRSMGSWLSFSKGWWLLWETVTKRRTFRSRNRCGSSGNWTDGKDTEGKDQMSTSKSETNETESKPTPVAPPLLTEEENWDWQWTQTLYIARHITQWLYDVASTLHSFSTEYYVLWPRKFLQNSALLIFCCPAHCQPFTWDLLCVLLNMC